MCNVEEYKRFLDAYDEVSGEIYRILYEYYPSHITDYDGLLSWEWNKEEQCIKIAYLDGRCYHKYMSIPLENVLNGEVSVESCDSIRVLLNTLDRQVEKFAEENIDDCFDVIGWTWDGEKGFIAILYADNCEEAKCKEVALEAIVNQ